MAAQPNNLKSKRLEIEHDPVFGFYLYVFERATPRIEGQTLGGHGMPGMDMGPGHLGPGPWIRGQFLGDGRWGTGPRNRGYLTGDRPLGFLGTDPLGVAT